MPRTRKLTNNFTSGELAPTLHDRYEYDGYKNGLAEMKGYAPIPQGGAKALAGTRYVTVVKNSTASRLIPFIFSETQAYVIEVGDGYMRFYTNGGQLQSGGVAVETVTPYSGAEILELYYAQFGDTLFIDQGDNPPSELLRLNATTFELRTSRLIPPPTIELGKDGGVHLLLSAATGNFQTATASAFYFIDSDVGRNLTQNKGVGTGNAVVTAVLSSTLAEINIIDTFSNINLAEDTYTLSGSPLSGLRVSVAGPVGNQVEVTAIGRALDAVETLTNGTFDSDLSGWTDNSGGIVAEGTADGSDTELLTDSLAQFITAGVAPGHRLLNTTDSTEDRILSVESEDALITSDDGAVWAAGKDYQIRKTGNVIQLAGTARFRGGPRGIAALYQGIPTTPGGIYRLTFDILTAPLAAMVGTFAGYSDLAAEATYDIKNGNEIIFKALSAVTYVEFRNNQDTDAGLDNVSLRSHQMESFFEGDIGRAGDVGRYIRVNDGIIEITRYDTPSQVVGIIRKELTDTLDALPGAWSLEDLRWSTIRGYPTSVTFHGDRLIHASTASDPQRLWGSVPGQYRNFGGGANDADAVEFDVVATDATPIMWIAGEKALLAGTTRQEFTIRGELSHTLTPSSIDATSPTRIGSIDLQPVRALDALLHVSRSGTRVYENFGIDDFSGDDRQPTDLSILAEHLTSGGIKRIAYQQEPHPIVWVVTNDGYLRGMTYLRKQGVVGWFQRPTQGVVLDVCVIPAGNGAYDQVWLLIDRGGLTPYIEYIDEHTGFYGQLLTDSTVSGTFDPPTDHIVGLDHLVGLGVVALVDGRPSSVTAGELDYEGVVIEAGLPMERTLTTLRPALDAEPLIGMFISNVRAYISVLNSVGITVNTELVDFGTTNDNYDAPPSLFTGLVEVDTTGWDTDAQITVTQSQTLPSLIRGVYRTLEIQSS